MFGWQEGHQLPPPKKNSIPQRFYSRIGRGGTPAGDYSDPSHLRKWLLNETGNSSFLPYESPISSNTRKENLLKTECA